MAQQAKQNGLTDLLLQSSLQSGHPERDGTDFRLGATAHLEELGRKAKYHPEILAGLCGVSKRTLERHIKAAYHLTPACWLRDLQVSDAICRICDGVMIKNIAAEMDFMNATHFSRAVRRHTGFTPMQLYQAWIQNGRIKPVPSATWREMVFLSRNGP